MCAFYFIYIFVYMCVSVCIFMHLCVYVYKYICVSFCQGIAETSKLTVWEIIVQILKEIQNLLVYLNKSVIKMLRPSSLFKRSNYDNTIHFATMAMNFYWKTAGSLNRRQQSKMTLKYWFSWMKSIIILNFGSNEIAEVSSYNSEKSVKFVQSARKSHFQRQKLKN